MAAEPGQPRAIEREHHRLVGLEFLRFAMALVVLIYHFANFYALDRGAIAPAGAGLLPCYRFLWPVYEYGSTAVQLFWAVSGFIFYHNYAARIAEGRVRPTEFAWVRF